VRETLVYDPALVDPCSLATTTVFANWWVPRRRTLRLALPSH